MSNQELDNLFKSKLEKLEKQPSANAWDKIQAGQRKRAFWPWVRIAAAVLLIFTMSAVVWLFMKRPAPDSQLADKKVAPVLESEKPFPSVGNDVTKEKSEPAIAAIEKNEEPTNKSDREVTKTNAVTERVKTSEPDQTREVSDAEEPSSMKLIESVDTKNSVAQLPDATITNETASDKHTVEDKGKTLEFNIEDFSNAKIANNTSPKESAETQKGIDKVLNLVRETGIGDLREAKNEILAFNFKKENDDSE